MVGLVVVSHSAQLAAGVVELAREMAGDVRLVPAGGMAPDEDSVSALGTDAARVMEAIEVADDGSGDGVLVLMDLGSAILSAETALDLLDPGVASRVRLVPAPLVEGAVAGAVAAQAGSALDAVAAEAAGGLGPKAAHLGEPTPAEPDPGRLRTYGSDRPTDPQSSADALEERFTVTVSQGLHARPAARFVRTAAARDATIEVINATTGAGPAPAGSLNAIATLGVREGHDVIVRASGPEAREAIEDLREVASGVAAGRAAAGSTAARAPAGTSPPPASASPADAPLVAAVSADPGTAAEGSAHPPAAASELRGLPASPGIAIAPIRQLGPAAPPPIQDEPAGSPDEEWKHLEAARNQVRIEIDERKERLASEVGADEAEILDALGLILDDEAILGPAKRDVENHASASRAWADAIQAIASRYAALEDPYQRARAADLEDVGRRVLAALYAPADTSLDASGAESAEQPIERSATEPSPQILTTHDLTPIDAAGLDPHTVAGIATETGGPTSHGAILARALGVPAVVGLGERVRAITDGTQAILDGDQGLLIPSPDEQQQRDYAERREQQRRQAQEAKALAHEPATTRDGTTVEVAANAGSPQDAREAASQGADGIGLLRTEFAFLHRDTEPSEDEQYEVYRQAAQALEGRPLVIRTLDAGADKPLPYLAMPREENPFLGVRGLRLGLQRPELLKTQLKAILRAAQEHENVKVMFPMVATRDELRAAKELLDEARRQTKAEPKPGFETGIMVEVPAAALTAARLAHEVDFFSIGTNDLTQYVLAAERGNAAVADLADGLHPAVLRLICMVCDAAAAHGRWVGVCGELGADPAATPLLVGLGVRELSVAAPSVATVKAAVRALDTDAATRLATQALSAATSAEVRALGVSDL